MFALHDFTSDVFTMLEPGTVTVFVLDNITQQHNNNNLEPAAGLLL